MRATRWQYLPRLVPINFHLCVAFICLTVPLTLFYVIIYSSDQFVTQSPGMALARTLVLILGLTNHAINFFLYVLISANFRTELMMMLGIQKSKGQSASQRAGIFHDGHWVRQQGHTNGLDTPVYIREIGNFSYVRIVINLNPMYLL